MRIDPRLTAASPPLHILAENPHHPDNTENVIDMLMRHKDIPRLLPVDPGLVQTPKDRIAASGIHEKASAILLKSKTGIITICHHCISGSQHCKLHCSLLSFFFIFFFP